MIFFGSSSRFLVLSTRVRLRARAGVGVPEISMSPSTDICSRQIRTGAATDAFLSVVGSKSSKEILLCLFMTDVLIFVVSSDLRSLLQTQGIVSSRVLGSIVHPLALFLAPEAAAARARCGCASGRHGYDSGEQRVRVRVSARWALPPLIMSVSTWSSFGWSGCARMVESAWSISTSITCLKATVVLVVIRQCRKAGRELFVRKTAFLWDPIVI